MKSFFKTNSTIGISISLNDLAMMAVDQRRQKPRVLAYSAVKLDSAKTSVSIEEVDGYLEEKMQELLKNNLVGKLDAHYAYVAIPTAKTFSRTVKLPTKVKNDLKTVLDLEIEQYIPIPKNLLTVSYEIISQNEEEMEVIITAAPTAIIERITSIMQSAGLEPIVIEPSMNSIARLLIDTEKGDLTTLIVDFEVNYTDIAILEKVIKINTSVELGGNHFTETIARELNIAPERAQQLKVLEGLGKGQYQQAITEALDKPLNRIIVEIERLIRYHKERLSGSEVNQVLMVGISSNIAGLSDYMTNRLNLPVRVANPWPDLDFGRLPKPKKATVARFLTAAGVANIKQDEALKWLT